MEFMDLINFMGQSPDVPELRQHLASAGVTRQPQPEPGEDMAYVQFAEQGYEMRFDRVADGPGTFLRSISAYPAGKATHRPFTGTLPAGLTADASRQQVHERLGPPVVSNKVFQSDMWKLGEWDLVVWFDKSTNAMKLVQVNVPKR